MAKRQRMMALELSADVGLLAVFLATADICLGQLIEVRYSPWRLWPHRRVNIFAVHTWSACFVMASLLDPSDESRGSLLLFASHRRAEAAHAASEAETTVSLDCVGHGHQIRVCGYPVIGFVVVKLERVGHLC
jgi:hypothetical protein